MLTGLRKVTVFGPTIGFLMMKEQYTLAVVCTIAYGVVNALAKFARK